MIWQQRRSYTRINLDGLKRWRRVMIADLRHKQNGPIRRVLRQWAARYRGFAQRRFDRLSKSGGGGQWPPLKASTKARRRKGKRRGKRDASGRFSKAGVFSLLRDTGILLAALTPRFLRKPGQLQRDIPFGVRVGFGGSDRHGKSGEGPTVADLASWHQAGAGNLPVRKIIVSPDHKTQQAMARDMERGLQRLIKACDIGPAR